MMPAYFSAVFLLVALPAIVLMTAWTIVTMARILFPELFDGSRRRVGARYAAPGRPATRVRSRDIVEDLHHHVAEEPPYPVDVDGTGPEPATIFDDLWLRRN